MAAAEVPAAEGLTPLQRTAAVLPPRVGQLRRGSAAAAAFFAGPAGPSARLSRPGAPGAPFRPAGRNRLLPADLTVAAPRTRSECARDRWRELDHLGQLDALITGPRLRHCATIAMVSPKGGVGKTTVTALLGTLFSLLRRDPTVAVDTNPDFGSLGRVLTPDQSRYVDDLARLVAEDDELSLTALDSQLGRAMHGLLVVPAPTDPARMASLDQDAYARVITRLKDFFSLILLDCGTGLQDPASAAAVASADQVVLLTDAQPATASLVAQSAELLHHHRRGQPDAGPGRPARPGPAQPVPAHCPRPGGHPRPGTRGDPAGGRRVRLARCPGRLAARPQAARRRPGRGLAAARAGSVRPCRAAANPLARPPAAASIVGVRTARGASLACPEAARAGETGWVTSRRRT